MRGAPRYWFPPNLHPTCRVGSYAFGRRRFGGVRAALQPSFLGWFWRICPFADLDQHPPECPTFRDNEPTCSLAMWACVIPPSDMQHAVLLGRDSWMRFNTRSYRALPPRPHDIRFFGELTLSHHATAGVSAYAIDPTAQDGGFHLLFDGTVGVTLSDEPQLLEVDLVRSNGSPALTGHYLVDILPQPGILSMQENFVASGRQVLPLTGVADLDPGDLVGVAHAPRLRVPLGALQHATYAAEPHPGQIADCQVSVSQVRLTQVRQPRP